MKKLNGYRVSHRNRWSLLQKGVLTPKEFALFEYYLDIMDFDQRHGNKFGTFEVFFDEIGLVFNKKEETIKDWHNGLLTKGFTILFDKKRSLCKIKNPLRYLTGEVWHGQASQYAKQEKVNNSLQFLLENVCFSPEKAEKNPESQPILDINNTPKALGSFKDEDSLNIPIKKKVIIKQEPRSEEEYQKIKQSGNLQELTTENIRWIDNNVREEISIENDEMEKEIVRIYFDSDWDMYKKQLTLG